MPRKPVVFHDDTKRPDRRADRKAKDKRQDAAMRANLSDAPYCAACNGPCRSLVTTQYGTHHGRLPGRQVVE